MVGDVTIEWELPDGGLYIMPSRHGAAAAFPGPGKNNFRLVRARSLASTLIPEDAACKRSSKRFRHRKSGQRVFQCSGCISVTGSDSSV